VVASAFGDHVEVADLVESLRCSSVFVPELSLVATRLDQIVGHVLCSIAELLDEDGDRHRVLVLSPLSVMPTHQRQGIGSMLVRDVLHRAETMGEQIVVLQGSPNYYPRLGFRDSRTMGITMRLPDWAPPEAGMARPLSAYDPSTRGRLIESQPFIDLA